jgi:bifunctional non-homologous end joining protein LigD
MRLPSGKLATYRSKRDFSKTAEPSGKRPTVKSKRRRYVVQKHAATRLHWDFRLEDDGVFKSWAVTRGPSLDPRDKRLAVEVEDHPLDYGDFEGVIPKGQYGGGTVQLWDRGYWESSGANSVDAQLKKGELKFRLDGERLHGGWVLVRMKSDRYGGKRTNWLLIKQRDEHARSQDEVARMMAEDRSVASSRTMAKIAAGVGRGPKPFVLGGKKAAKADATWTSKGARDIDVTSTSSSPSRRRRPDRRSRKKMGPRLRGDGRARPPAFIEPELCKLVERPPTAGPWAHEVKLDGYRMQLRVVNGKASLKTRKGLDWTERFAAIAAQARGFDDCIIDGEVVALDESGAPDFAALQAAIAEGDSDALVYFVFDLLYAGGEDLRERLLAERKAKLQSFLRMQRVRKTSLIRYVDHFESPGDAVLESACRMNLEGIISKRLDAPYVSGRSGDWLKSKCRAGHEVVIGGYTHEHGRLRSLLVGVYRDGDLAPVGRVGTGFSRAKVQQLMPRLKALATDRNPFTGEDAPRKSADVRWVQPKLVAEIEFAGWTASGQVRQAAFKGLREDKPAREVAAETPAAPADTELTEPKASRALSSPSSTVRAKTMKRATKRGEVTKRERTQSAGSAVVKGVTLSKPDKPLWPATDSGPAVTKLDLARYYEQVGDWLLLHIRGRPCSIIRAPEGIEGERFFQRHGMPGVSSLITLTKVAGDRKPYVQIDRVEALIAVAQTAAVELHPWNCQPSQPETPGRLVFDLDPAPEVEFDAVIAAAREMKEQLEALGLVAFCKTTGGKGLHVVTPLAQPRRGKLDWTAAKAFAQAVCARMAQDNPDRYLINMSKKQRAGRIFLDYLRNDRMSTAVAPLSPRMRAGAPVSMPLTWSQVRAGLDPQRYTLRTAPALIAKSSAWEDYCDSERPLEPAIREVLGEGARTPGSPGRSRRRNAGRVHASS